MFSPQPMTGSKGTNCNKFDGVRSDGTGDSAMSLNFQGARVRHQTVFACILFSHSDKSASNRLLQPVPRAYLWPPRVMMSLNVV